MMSAIFQEGNEVCVVLSENDFINVMPFNNVNVRYVIRNKNGKIVIDDIKEKKLKNKEIISIGGCNE